MDDEACKAIGTVLVIIGHLLERAGICSMMELANRIGNMAVITGETAPEFERRGEYLATMAFCVLAGAQGAPTSPENRPN
jgi:hypothetical protein